MLRLLLVFAIVLGSCEGFVSVNAAIRAGVRNSKKAAPMMSDDSLGNAMKKVSAFFDKPTDTGPTIAEIEQYCSDPEGTECDVEMIERLMAEAEKMKLCYVGDPIYWSPGATFSLPHQCCCEHDGITSGCLYAQILTRPCSRRSRKCENEAMTGERQRVISPTFAGGVVQTANTCGQGHVASAITEREINQPPRISVADPATALCA